MTEKGDSDIVSNMMLLSGKHTLCQIIKPSKSCPDRLYRTAQPPLPFSIQRQTNLPYFKIQRQMGLLMSLKSPIDEATMLPIKLTSLDENLQITPGD